MSKVVVGLLLLFDLCICLTNVYVQHMLDNWQCSAAAHHLQGEMEDRKALFSCYYWALYCWNKEEMQTTHRSPPPASLWFTILVRLGPLTTDRDPGKLIRANASKLRDLRVADCLKLHFIRMVLCAVSAMSGTPTCEGTISSTLIGIIKTFRCMDKFRQ